jgi:hypothetical protein
MTALTLEVAKTSIGHLDGKTAEGGYPSHAMPAVGTVKPRYSLADGAGLALGDDDFGGGGGGSMISRKPLLK